MSSNISFKRVGALLLGGLLMSQGMPIQPEVRGLQNEVARFRDEMGRLSLTPAHVDRWLPTYCFPITQLERDLKGAMEEARPQIVSEEDLQRYGNKHANLVKMSHLVNALEWKEVGIPAPHGISSDQIHSFLRKKAPKIFELWQSGDETVLPEIDRMIQEAFNADDAWEILGLSPEFVQWIEGQKDGYLMVRSTGAEDTKEMANAGGNESIAYVPTESKAICKAIGDVVRSYFSPHSLHIRKNAGTNPFAEELRLAVTLQELIGEPIGGASSNIPVSFVLFTNEPLYIGKEKFRAMRLSATYGHGEAVVKNKGIGTDSVLILISESQPDQLYYLYNNQKKPERLAPVRNSDGQVELKSIANPSDLETQPAISPKQLEALYRSGVLMEAFFGDYPTDIEGVIKGNQIYFVQARPVVRKPLLPTYLRLEESAIAQRVQAEMVVPGKASVVAMTKRDEVIIAETLDEAERMHRDRPDVKLVIVKHPEPDNSHSVVNFSGLMMPCLYTDQSEEVEKLLGQISENQPLVACMQTATLSLWKKEAASLEDHIVEGFAVHPAKIAISLRPHVVSEPGPVSKELVGLLNQIRDEQNPLDALEQIAQHPQVKYLRGKAASLEDREIPSAAQERFAILDQLDWAISQAIADMRAVLNSGGRLNKLLHLKVLETLLIGGTSGFGHYSLRDVESLSQSINTFLSYQKELRFPARAADLLLDGEANPEAFPHWKQLLLNLESLLHNGKISEQEWRQFRKLITVLRETGTLSTWMTFFQGQAKSSLFRSTESMQLERFKNIISQADTNSLAEMTALTKEQRSLEQIRTHLDRFSDEKNFLEAWSELQKHIALLSSDEWVERFQKGSPIVQSIALKTMEQLVDTIDRSIKTMKSSQMPERVKLFKTMLDPFFEMMRVWAEKMVPAGKIPMATPLPEYLDQMRMSLNTRLEHPSQLLPSRDFSVSAAMMGSGAAFERHQPRTLEDLLTLIHQNSLVAINALLQDQLSTDQITQSLLPETVKSAMRQIERGYGRRTFQRMGMQIFSKKIVIHYNVPLRNHSGHVELHYDLATGKMIFKGQLLGQARTRWGDTAYWIQALEAAKVFSSSKPLFQNEQELTFSWNIAPDTLPMAIREYAEMAEFSLDDGLFLEPLYRRFSSQPEIQQGLLNYFLENIHDQAISFYLSQIDAGKEDLVPKLLDLVKNHYHVNPNLTERLLEELFKRQKGVQEISDWAVSEAKINRNFRPLIFLVKKGMVLDQALEIAKWNFRETSLWEALILKNQGIQELIELIKANPADQYSVIHIYDLLKWHREIDPVFALEITQKYLQSKEGEFDSNHFLAMLSLLVKKGVGVELAIQQVTSELEIDDVYELLTTLIEEGHYSERLKEITVKTLEEEVFFERSTPIVEALTLKNLEPELCINYVNKRFASTMDINRLVSIMTTWVKHGKGYAEALKMIQDNAHVRSLFEPEWTFIPLIDALYEKGQVSMIDRLQAKAKAGWESAYPWILNTGVIATAGLIIGKAVTSTFAAYRKIRDVAKAPRLPKSLNLPI